MSFNIIESSKNISNKYKRYLKTMFDIKDPEYKAIFDQRLEDSKTFEKGPFLDVTNSFKKGKSIQELINEDVLAKDFARIERLYNIPSLHYHQEQALRKAMDGDNLIVSTGTGSGKTECFLLPLINDLMREKEAGTLCDGVRALIIYPMNALANDQIDRLRKLFIEYPDITFGCYTGQTKHHNETRGNNKGAIDQYIELNSKRIDDIRLQKPLKNERLSRDSMKTNPPHILITNYAMLEYLMLRPEDSVFFDGDKAKYWKYIILDEAHTYTGSTGIEVSMLLRRLKAKLPVSKLQFILTSATLGNEESNNEVVDFAERLCSEHFSTQSIIRAERVELEKLEPKYTFTPDFFSYVNGLIEYGYSEDYIINSLENEYHFNLAEKTLAEYFFELLIRDNTFWKIKTFLSKAKSIEEIREYIGWNEKEISDFVEVASEAVKNQSKLFDSRYHMFLRATEGVYITLSPHKDLFLTRKNKAYYENDEYKVFEAISCTQCHSLYLIGQIDERGYLVQKNNYSSDDIKEAFYLGDQINDTDEDESLENSDMKAEVYELCPHCGFIRSTKAVHKTSCGHDESHFVNVVRVNTTNPKTGRVIKCIACESVNRLGILRGFFSGQEASTSVIGTALFEELPSHYKKVTIHQSEEDGFDIDLGESVEEFAKAKQFIAFSDSRQAAAYFASYFSVSYDGFLYGKIIRDVIGSMSVPQMEFKLFVEALSGIFRENNIMPFDEYVHRLNNQSVFSFDCEKVAWQAILKELIENNSRNSLYGLGLISFGFNNHIVFGPHKKYKLDVNDVKNICMIFVLGMMTDAAIHYPQNMNDIDKAYFTHNGIELSYLMDSGSKYVRAFIPQNDSGMNKRLDYLMRILERIDSEVTREDAKNVLKQIWTSFFAPEKTDRPQILYRNKEAKYQVNVENLVVEKSSKWYRCDKCKKLTAYNVKNVCPTYRCEGTLEEVNIDELEKENHYYRMYHDLAVEPLRVVEHTAQLNREEAYQFQNLFKDQKIDVLSCSTTFEMGVDVGDLETVFMRNMPPSAANYAQRAGRAGRSSTAAAFALTFCNKSNHDFNYFEKPTDMISGLIMPPNFKTDNEKICIRHLYSSAFSFFFKQYPDYFTNAKDMMDKNETTGLSGYDVFEQFLKRESEVRQQLQFFLLDSVPESLHSKFSIKTFGWVKWLFDEKHEEYPNLKNVRDVYLQELKILRVEYEKAKEQGSGEMFEFSKRIRNYEEEQIISFLSRNNILPKYGFPVDTVKLDINGKSGNELSGCDLSRDLSMAISEYAPGCQIVANNRLLTSRYIKKIPGFDWKKYDYIECEKCKTLNIITHQFIQPGDEHPLSVCKQCQEALDKKRIKTFLIPEFGFVTEEKIVKPSLIKPERTYRTEASFFNYAENTPENLFNIGGTEVSVAVVGNDGEMAMLNTTDFFVCPQCGYTIEAPDGINPFARGINEKDKHKKPDGYPCKNQYLERYSLGYKFMSDVVRIRIKQPLMTTDKQHEEAYSILQALILAACKELNIEYTEIAGCLQYYFDGGINYSYILYDTTPGGAGHVKRLNDRDVIHHVLINAMNATQKCPNCDDDSSCYSCLRTYQNQKYHDILKRNYVFNYLGQILNGYCEDELDSPLEERFMLKLHGAASSWIEKNRGTKIVYKAKYGENEWEIEPQVYLDLMQNVIKPSKPDFIITPLNSNHKKIAVFTDGFRYHNDKVDDDSIKRDAIIFSKNYRVWNLSWSDVCASPEKEYATPIFDKLDYSGIEYKPTSKNSFDLLLKYLSDKDGESKMESVAKRTFDEMIKGTQTSDFHYSLAQLCDEIDLVRWDGVHKQAEFKISDNSHLRAYLINDDRLLSVVYLQDYISKRKPEFVQDWNSFLQLSNILQFVDDFVMVTQKGLDEEKYSILSGVIYSTEICDSTWNEIAMMITNQAAKSFVEECIANGIVAPSTVGYENDEGFIAELEWDTQRVVYLTEEQMCYKDSFEKQGFSIVTSVSDFEKIAKE